MQYESNIVMTRFSHFPAVLLALCVGCSSTNDDAAGSASGGAGGSAGTGAGGTSSTAGAAGAAGYGGQPTGTGAGGPGGTGGIGGAGGAGASVGSGGTGGVVACDVNVKTLGELNTAIGAASAGDCICLAQGNYGTLNLKQVKFSAPVTVKSADRKAPATFTTARIVDTSNVTLDGLVFDYTFSASDKETVNLFSVDTSDHIVIRDSLFDGDFAKGTGTSADGAGFGRGLSVVKSSEVALINNEFRKWWKGFSMSTGSQYSVIGNDVHTIRSDGLNFGQVTGLLVEKNYIHDFKSAPNTADHRDMIQILRSSGIGSSDIVIRNNIFDMAAGEYTQTIWSGTDGSSAVLKNVLVENNIVYNAHTNGIAMHSIQGIVIRKNTVLRVPRAETAKVTIPNINVGSGSTNVTMEKNVVKGIFGLNTPGWTVSGNALVQDTDPAGPGYYDNEFIYHAKTQPDGYNEFSVKPGGTVASLGAGSDLTKLYPLGKAATLAALRALP